MPQTPGRTAPAPGSFVLTLASLLLSGLVQAAISPPLNLIVLHPLAWVPAFRVFRSLRGRRAFAAGWLVGTSANLAIFVWLPGTVERFGHLPWIAALAIWVLYAAATGLATAVFAWGFARVRDAAGRAWPVALAAWFSAIEFLWPQLFGYLQGNAWYQVPHLFLASAATGASGLTFLVILANAVALQGLETREGRETPRAFAGNAALLAGLVLAAFAYSSQRLATIARAEEDAPTRRIAIVQPNHTIDRRFQMDREKPSVFAADLVALSREAAASVTDGRAIDVYVWPEGALRSDPVRLANRAALEFAKTSGAEVWTGANVDLYEGARRTASHNSAFRIRGDGTLDRRYDKNILVPFGEYVPLRDVIPGFRRLPTAALYDAGTETPVYEAGPLRFVFLICYEAIRSGYVRRAASPDVNLLVNVTVDAWYGDSSEQSQHLMLAASQSAMLGVPLVRSTTTGISAFVDARGVLVAQSGKFTREVLVEDVKPVRVEGLYSRFGDWFAWSCVAAVALLLAISRRETGR